MALKLVMTESTAMAMDAVFYVKLKLTQLAQPLQPQENARFVGMGSRMAPKLVMTAIFRIPMDVIALAKLLLILCALFLHWLDLVHDAETEL